MGMYGVLMPKEPKIAQMDWRSLGYWPVYNNGKKEWVPQNEKNSED
jgi:hypothetical protein